MVEQPPVSRTSGINSSLTAAWRLLLFTFKIKIPIVLILRQKAYYIRRRNGCVTFSVTIITITSPQSYGDSNPDHSIWNLPRETPGHSLSLIKQKKVAFDSLHRVENFWKEIEFVFTCPKISSLTVNDKSRAPLISFSITHVMLWWKSESIASTSLRSHGLKKHNWIQWEHFHRSEERDK